MEGKNWLAESLHSKDFEAVACHGQRGMREELKWTWAELCLPITEGK
jgi:hypothetical protein